MNLQFEFCLKCAAMIYLGYQGYFMDHKPDPDYKTTHELWHRENDRV